MNTMKKTIIKYSITVAIIIALIAIYIYTTENKIANPYFFPKVSKIKKAFDDSKNLMLENLTDKLETEVFATGVINKNFVVVRDSKAPAVLLEIGFMSCPEELERLVKDKFSMKVAKTIYNTVLDIYEDAGR